jgi:hypothetical protein
MSSQKVRSDSTELKKINAEISRLAQLMKPLKARKKEIEENLLKYLAEVNKTQGVNVIKLQDIEIAAVERRTRERLHKDEKEQAALQVLEQNGVANPRKLYSDLQEMIKGKTLVTNKLQMKEKK